MLFLATTTGCTLSPSRPATRPDPRLLQQEAETAYAAGRWDSAAGQYETLLKVEPESAVHWFRLGNALVRAQRLEAAESAYSAAVQRDPQLAKAWYNLAVVRLRLASTNLQRAATAPEGAAETAGPAASKRDALAPLLDAAAP